MEIKEYKCPNCGGAVKFDSSVRKMKCPYCDSEFGIEALDEYRREAAVPVKDSFEWKNASSLKPWEGGDLDDLAAGSCPSCGAEIVGNKNTIAAVCPFCGNAQIVEKRVEGLLKPEYVVPFKLDKKAAAEALKNFYADKKLLPDLFREENRVNAIQGMYVPFWLFDARARGRARYRAAKTRMWSDSNYNYTQTSYYSVTREGSLDFEKIPVDGSEKMDDSYMDAIEPFDYAAMKEFQPAFLAGYSAEKYDVDADKSRERANERIKNSITSEFIKTVTGYSSVVPESASVSAEGKKLSYVLFPVWILNSKYKGKNYLFVMNGESGRLVGKLPADSGKVWKYRLVTAGISGAIFTAVIQLLRLFM